ncbi:hypothetical protein MUO14_14695 [Halobacillus shinanisalinarum]|uniref:Beta-carotene 15,15'-monooxygenase n=1 Tax=Halobacillus shinanisalinarum TaxID=2932258 RepID=A0ABY4GUF8_9BACI|nr:hypothetical protein [Halobacillus shinanisalinarum]UOQ91783.1 hypothetical protein MUO14_14695 [Halobacillus shinanisalinarum]
MDLWGTLYLQRRSFYIGLSLILLILLSHFSVQKLGLTGLVQPWLVYVTIIDVMIVVPAVLFLIVLRRKPTLTVFAPLMVSGLLFLHWIVPSYAKDNLLYLNYTVIMLEVSFLCVELILAVMFIRKLPEWREHFKDAKTTHVLLMPRLFYANEKTFAFKGKLAYFERLGGFLATDAAAIRFSLFPWLDSYPSHQQSFSYHRNSEYFSVFLMLIHAMAIEIIAVHAMIAQFSHTAAWLATFLDVYALLFLIGDYQAVRKSPVVIKKQVLHIQKGLRFHITVPFEEIAAIAPFEKTTAEYSKIKQGVNLTLGGLETKAPQFELMLRTTLDAYMVFGFKKKVSTIYLTVDEPEIFLKELSASIGVSNFQ